MARPRKEIDQKQFENLCGLWCTEQEIADWFECSVDTIDRWCKRVYEMSFAEAYKKYSLNGKITLRRNQLRLSEKSAAMAIFLGKNYLGQKDNIQDEEFSTDVVAKLDMVANALKGVGNDGESESER